MKYTKPGGYYLNTPLGMIEATSAAGLPPDVVICRRVVDLPVGRAFPANAKFGTCARCGQSILYSPVSPHQDKPKACMQCCGIEPLPY